MCGSRSGSDSIFLNLNPGSSNPNPYLNPTGNGRQQVAVKWVWGWLAKFWTWIPIQIHPIFLESASGFAFLRSEAELKFEYKSCQKSLGSGSSPNPGSDSHIIEICKAQPVVCSMCIVPSINTRRTFIGRWNMVIIIRAVVRMQIGPPSKIACQFFLAKLNKNTI